MTFTLTMLFALLQQTAFSSPEWALLSGRLSLVALQTRCRRRRCTLCSLSVCCQTRNFNCATVINNANYRTNCKVTCKGSAVSELDVRNLNCSWRNFPSLHVDVIAKNHCPIFFNAAWSKLPSFQLIMSGSKAF